MKKIFIVMMIAGSIEACARRELYEETGAVTYTLERFCDYGVVEKTGSKESFGTIFYAKIEKMVKYPLF